MSKPTALSAAPEETPATPTPETPETPATPAPEPQETPATPEETPAAPESAPEATTAPGIFANLRAAVTGKGKLLSENARLADQVAKLTLELTSLRADHAKATADLASAIAERDGYKGQLAELNKAVNAELESIGIATEKLPQTTGPDAGDLLAQFEDLKGSERIAFFRKHEKALFRAAK